MNNIDRRDKGLVYISDDSVFTEQKRARILTQKRNTVDVATVMQILATS